MRPGDVGLFYAWIVAGISSSGALLHELLFLGESSSSCIVRILGYFSLADNFDYHNGMENPIITEGWLYLALFHFPQC